MERITVTERPDWRARARKLGFHFHTLEGAPYWDESACYRFSLDEVENELEAPTAELGAMCAAAAREAAQSENWLRRLQIPEAHWDYVAGSLRAEEPSLYARLDLAYTGQGPAKLLENNADTPTSLYETAFWQWLWLEEQIKAGALPADADQFNSLQDQLVARLRQCADSWGERLHFSCCRDSLEDRGTVYYLEDCAREAGLTPEFLYVDEIGLSEDGYFTDRHHRPIEALFKLYPWEFMLREPFAEQLAASGTRFIEPPWKALISNKGLLALLWEMYPGHRNLLPAYFADDPRARDLAEYVKKPIFAREGANVTLQRHGHPTLTTPGPYGEEGYIVQAYTPLPVFGGHHVLLGSWLVGDSPAGLSVREDDGPITQDTSRFLPHYIG